jgi:2-keto-4-pentenoate hydratase/2-oxohepta-3-ene-1,7-dioic acid hydratase in catechol pathway
MKLRRVRDGGSPVVQIQVGEGWVNVQELLNRGSRQLQPSEIGRWSADIVALLGAPKSVLADVARAAIESQQGGRNGSHVEPLIPFEPRSYRDFMIYELHAIAAARGFVERFMPKLLPITRVYESLTGKDFPKFKPAPLWYRQPIFYVGNHLSFVTDGSDVVCPDYSKALDYELELGFVLSAGLFNATPDEAEAAIGGFVVLNDFTARDVQLDEMRSGFGPTKAKNFANAISHVVVSADDILPRWRSLKGYVKINGDIISETVGGNPRWSLGEMLAHASRSEHLYAGEFFATGTFPGGSGIETARLLRPGDTIEIGIYEIGSVANTIISSEEDART